MSRLVFYPITKYELPSEYKEWEELAHQLPTLINTRTLRKKVNEMKFIHEPFFSSKAEWERAMLLLSFLGNAYVFGKNNPVQFLPSSISIPWMKIANKLERKPILSHASAVLQNWKIINPKLPFTIDNINTRIKFQENIDEAWFFLITVIMEKTGGVGIKNCVDALLAVEQDDEAKVLFSLENVAKNIKDLIQELKKIKINCNPYNFYHNVRPFLASFENIEYQGVENNVVNSFHGGSAAQSSLIQTFDAALGIQHDNYFLEEMRNYMPSHHRDFLRFLDFKSNIKSYCFSHKNLISIYNECVSLLKEFRNEHLKIVAEYIIKQKGKIGSAQKGTGGTNPIVFLKEIRDNIN